jgi:hypothetical protein
MYNRTTMSEIINNSRRRSALIIDNKQIKIKITNGS